MKKYVLVCFMCIGLLFVTFSFAEGTNDVLHRFLSEGEVEGQVGVAFNLIANRDSDKPDQGLAWGLMELGYTTPSLYGFKVGAYGIFVQEIWENHDGDYKNVYTKDADLRNLFISYTLASNMIVAGRCPFYKNAAMDGDSYQGLEVSICSIPYASIHACVIDRWINNDTTFFDADGITGWEDIDNVNHEAGHEFYGGSLSIEIPKTGHLSPFINYQEHVMTVYGSSLDLRFALTDILSLGFDSTYAIYANEVPETIKADYEDVSSWIAHASLQHDQFSLGFGWYDVSDDHGDTMAGMFDSIDPMENDDLFPYDDRNNAHLWYIDGKLTIHPILFQAAFASGQNDALKSWSRELDLWLYYNITDYLQWSGYYVWTDYETDVIPSYTQVGSSILYKF